MQEDATGGAIEGVWVSSRSAAPTGHTAGGMSRLTTHTSLCYMSHDASLLRVNLEPRPNSGTPRSSIS